MDGAAFFVFLFGAPDRSPGPQSYLFPVARVAGPTRGHYYLYFRLSATASSSQRLL